MKKIIILVSLFYSFQLAAQSTNLKLTPIPVLKLKTANDSVQYALGGYLAQWINANGFVVVDATTFLTGMEDVLKNKPRLINDNNIASIINTYQKDSKLKKAKSLELDLFNSLKDMPGIGKLPSGVQYSILKPSKGIKATEIDTVVCNIKGILADGTLFEDTYATKRPIFSLPSLFFPGLSEAIQLMPQGSIWKLYIPSAQAYGEKGNGNNIPSNSALIMIVEIIEVRVKKG